MGSFQADAIQTAADAVVLYDILSREDMDPSSSSGSDLKAGYLCSICINGHCIANGASVQQRPSPALQDNRPSYIQALSIDPFLDDYSISGIRPVYGPLEALSLADDMSCPTGY